MEMMILHTIKNDLSIIEFKQGYIKIQDNNKSISLSDIKSKLFEITGLKWLIESVSDIEGVNYGLKEKSIINERKELIKNQDLIQKILKSFSGIEIDDIKLSNIDNKK